MNRLSLLALGLFVVRVRHVLDPPVLDRTAINPGAQRGSWRVLLGPVDRLLARSSRGRGDASSRRIGLDVLRPCAGRATVGDRGRGLEAVAVGRHFEKPFAALGSLIDISF